MNFIYLAILGYFFLAVEAVASKYLLSGERNNWRLYLFFVSVLSLFAFIFSPFGLFWWGWELFFQAFFSGIIFFFSLSFLFSALTSSAASRVFVLFGAVSTLSGFFLMKIFFQENLAINERLGIIFLLFGGFLISYKISQRRFFRKFKQIVFAGILSGISLVILKQVYQESNFVSGYIFSRLGLFLPSLFFLMIPSWRKRIFYQKNKLSGKISFWRVVPVKILAGLGTALVSFSISIGSLTIVNALVSIQYLLTFFLTLILASFFQEFAKEKVPWQDAFFKLTGVISIIGGIVFFNFS